jgi:bifunctional non-homologous end joining protein LigD
MRRTRLPLDAASGAGFARPSHAFALPSLVSLSMAFQPMPLSRKPAPFDHPEWVFELKYDGFRSLAVIQNGRTELISRNGHPFNSFDTPRTDRAE